MNKFKKGDKVNIYDGSYCFGIQNGEYTSWCNCFNGDRKNLTIIAVGLSVMKFGFHQITYGEYSVVNDLLVTDNNDGFWFTQSRFCDLIEPTHTIIIDGKTIKLSHKSFLNLKEQLI